MKQSANWQKLADIPEDKFEEYLQKENSSTESILRLHREDTAAERARDNLEKKLNPLRKPPTTREEQLKHITEDRVLSVGKSIVELKKWLGMAEYAAGKLAVTARLSGGLYINVTKPMRHDLQHCMEFFAGIEKHLRDAVKHGLDIKIKGE